jgi:hypothetical protein
LAAADALEGFAKMQPAGYFHDKALRQMGGLPGLINYHAEPGPGELLAEIDALANEWSDTQSEYEGIYTNARRIALLAFEAAARECDDQAETGDGRDCATAIRALSARLGE